MKDPLAKLNGVSGTPVHAVLRIRILQIAAVLLFGVLLALVGRMQIFQRDYYAQLANRMRFREIALPAQRGVMYDRRGELLVRNVPSFAVTVVPADLPDDPAARARVIRRLVELLHIQDDSWIVPPYRQGGAGSAANWEAQALAESLRRREGRRDPITYLTELLEEAEALAPYQPVVIRSGVDRDVAFTIEEERLYLPGVQVTVQPQRSYPAGELMAHLLGYMGPIPRELRETYISQGYAPTDQVGLAGLELQYEAELRGVKGRKTIEVDVAGREVRTIGEITPPTPGNNLVLSIDLALQRATEQLLAKALQQAKSPSGVAIAMNPQNGEVLAMVSLPGYDNNLFAGGIKPEDYERLNADERRPLVNHAIMGQYPPGSTFKIVPAAGGLQEGVITPRTLIRCDGIMYVPNQYFPDDPTKAQPFYCWIHKYGHGHGAIALEEAIVQSCDIFFYQVAGGFQDFAGLGLERLASYAHAFGFGELTGIDLPGEVRGLVPTAQWKRLNYSESWVKGDTYNMAIGQGFVLATPLQVVNAFAAIANGGSLYQPHVVRQIVDAEGKVVREVGPQLIRRLPVEESYIREIQRGLEQAVERGTGRQAALQGIHVAGKTGTAEFPGKRDAKGNLPTHAWFVAYAPAENPEIAVVVFIYGGGEGSSVAAPVAGEILSAYFGVPRLYSGE